MSNVQSAFRKFKSRLELNKQEQTNASSRQKEVRSYLNKEFDIDRDFLTGSYARSTKTKPLKDIDIFFELGEEDKDYRKEHPDKVLTAFYDALAEEYGSNAVTKQSHSVCVDFGVVVDADDNTDYRVVSIDAVPAFKDGENYLIPNTRSENWMKTNPEVHAELTTKANEKYGGNWKGLVRMVKYWNQNARHGEKPIKPSFLIEVMALECLYGEWGGFYDREIQAFFATIGDRISEDWPDPANLGGPVSDRMNGTLLENALQKLNDANREIAEAIHLSRIGKNTDAIKAWRNFFGPRFPMNVT